MGCNPRRWLTMLRAQRRKVLCAWLPIFVLSAVAGPACAAMHGDEPATTTSAAALHAPATDHEHHGHGIAHDSQPASPEPRPCPHCLLAGAANVGHDVCAATESPDHRSFVTAKDMTQRPQLALAPSWLLPAARVAPPLIAHPPPRAISPVAAVPLRISHCVLLI